MSYIDNIKLEGEIGDKRFVLPDGQRTKTFYDASEFDDVTGEFSIFDKSNNVVEYMDLMGHFTQNQTELAKYLSEYSQSGQFIPVKKFAYGDLYYCGLVDFPSRFLADDEVYDFIRNYEKLRYKRLCKAGCFRSLYERLYYKNYVAGVWRAKIKKLKWLQAQEKNIDEDIDSKELS